MNDKQIADLRKLFWSKAQPKDHITTAQVSEVNRDSLDIKVVSVKATVDGVPDQILGGVSEGAAVGVGDMVEVARPYTQKVNPSWVFKRVISSTLPFGTPRPPAPTLPVPIGLTLTSTTYSPTPGGLVSRINVSWTPLENVYGVDRYVVAYRTNTDTDWHESQVKHVFGVTQSYLITGLQAETDYNIKLKAVGKNGSESAWTDVSTITTSGDTTPPAVPTGLAGQSAILQNVLSWNRNTEYDFAYYNVYSASGAAGPPWELKTQAKRNGWTHVGSAYDQFCYTLEAIDNSGNTSEKCDSVGPTQMLPLGISLPDADVTAPPVIQDSDFGYTATIEKDANGNWRAFILLSVTCGPSNYVKPSDFSHFVFKLTRVSDGVIRYYNTKTSAETSIKISDWLDFSTSYTAYVLGQDKSGNQSSWNTTPESITTSSPGTPPTPLVAPTLSTSFKLMKVAFTWIDNNNIDYVEYQRATNSGFSANLFTFISNGYQRPPGGSGTYWKIDGTDATYPLTPNTLYYYRYRFRNADDGSSSSWSPSSNATVSQIGASDIVANSITANQIAAGTITATEIAANTITADELTIGGTASNLVLNPGAEQGLISWTASTVANLTASSATKYAGTKSFALTNTTNVAYAVSRAFPIVPGIVYTAKVAVGGVPARASGLYLRAHCATALPTSEYIYQSSPGYTLAQMYMDGVIQDNKALYNDWNHVYEMTFTAPAGCYWASFAVFNYWPTASGAETVYFDEVEVYKQFGSVHIRDGVITADKLEANLVIATTIIAGTLGAARIQLNSSGIYGYNSSNVEQVRIQSSDGSIYSTDNAAAPRQLRIHQGTLEFYYDGTSRGTIRGGGAQYGLPNNIIINPGAGAYLQVTETLSCDGNVINSTGFMTPGSQAGDLILSHRFPTVNCHAAFGASGGATMWWSGAQTWIFDVAFGVGVTDPWLYGMAVDTPESTGVIVSCSARSRTQATFYGASMWNERDPDIDVLATAIS